MKKPAIGSGSGLARPPMEELVLALGLGLIIFLRPWYDGITFPEYNVTFTWACAFLAALWGIFALTGRMTVRYVLPVLLLAAFLLVAALTSFFTVQYDATYRSLINWAGYLMLFAVAANGLRSRSAIGVVLAFFVVTSMAEAIYGVLHVNYIMPRTRALIMQDPSLIQRFFGTDRLTPELSARLESNRASGSLLFANALACWALSGIPLAIGATNGLYLRLRETLADSQPAAGSRNFAASRNALFATLLVGVVVFFAATLFYTVFFVFAYGDTANWTDYMGRWILYCIVIPFALTSAAWYVAHRHGTAIMLQGAVTCVTALFGIVMVYGLGATYSRGGILAAAAALSLLAILMYRHKRQPAATPVIQHVAAALLILTSFFAAFQFAEAQQPAPAAPPENRLALEGVNPSWNAMLDPNTAMLRFGYWISGLQMLAAHPFTGVGLGNFGTVYPMYQLLGAGDVKPAHNDYLQAACETGVFGLIAFLGFWCFFWWFNEGSVLREQDRALRWFRAGLFSSVIGFLLHSFVDFNFFNPSLAALAFILAGLTFATAPVAQTALKGGRGLAASLIAVALWSVYAGYQVNHVDNVIGRDMTRRTRLDAAELLLNVRNHDLDKPFGMYDGTVAMLIESRQTRESIGKIFVPTRAGASSGRYLKPGEEIPPTAMLIMDNFGAGRAAALAAIPQWIDRCIAADKVYPHDPETSAHVLQWYDKLREFSPDAAEKVKASDACIQWAEECIRRSPLQTAYHDALAKALWDRGELETTTKQVEFFDRSIAEFRKCAEIYPIKPVIWRDLADRCIRYGRARISAGDQAGGQKLVDEGNDALRRAQELEEKLAKVGRAA